MRLLAQLGAVAHLAWHLQARQEIKKVPLLQHVIADQAPEAGELPFLVNVDDAFKRSQIQATRCLPRAPVCHWVLGRSAEGR